MNNLPTLQSTDINFNCEVTKQESQLLINAKNNIAKSFRDGQNFRTETEFDISVLNDISHPTPDSKYWQCHLELRVHSNELVLMDFDIRIKESEIRELRDACDAEKKRIEIEKEEYILTFMKKQVKDRIQEVAQIDKQMNKLKDECIFSTEDVNEHQLFSYAFKYAREVNTSVNAPGTTAGEKRNMIAHLVTALSRIKDSPILTKKMMEIMPKDIYKILVNFKLLQEVEDK